MAKPLANGIPIGAILVRDDVVKAVTVGAWALCTPALFKLSI